MTRWVTVPALAAALAAAACNSSSDASSSLTPTVTNPTVTTPLNGTIAAPVGGVPQSATVTFNSSSSGTGSVTLTSAVETFSNGSLNPNVVVNLSLGVGGVNNCVLPAGNTPLPISASANPLSAPYVAGANCFVLTSGDQSSTAGPVSFTLVVLAY